MPDETINKVPPPTGSDEEKRQQSEAARKAHAAQASQTPPTASMPAPGFKERVFTSMTKKTHDLFKLVVATCRKNISYLPNKVNLENVEHMHFFHTIDSHGQRQEFCSFTAGHTHRVKVAERDGSVGAVCEPAIREGEKRTGANRIIKIYEKVLLGEDDNGEMIVDNHVHECQYMRSEELTVPASE